MVDILANANKDEPHFLSEVPTRQEAEEAVKTLLLWIGENPNREGLRDTPARVIRSYEELFGGYKLSAEEALKTVFTEVKGYKDEICIADIPFHSHCEHHMVPIIGKASVAYIPNEKIVGLSKIPRIIDIFSKRLQTQEALTAQIADALMQFLTPKGVAIFISAEHMCMAMRGVKKHGSQTLTQSFRGVYAVDESLQRRFLSAVRGS